MTAEEADKLTPQFKELLDNMASVKRRVFVGLLSLPLGVGTSKRIGEAARVDRHVVSAVLIRLSRDGIVRHDGARRNRLYEPRDWRIGEWYKIRSKRNDPA